MTDSSQGEKLTPTKFNRLKVKQRYDLYSIEHDRAKSAILQMKNTVDISNKHRKDAIDLQARYNKSMRLFKWSLAVNGLAILGFMLWLIF